MKNFIDTIKVLTQKKKYINDLCGFYGNPYGVRNHLRELMNSNTILSKGKLLQMIEEMGEFVIKSPEKCAKTMQSMKQLLTDIEGEPYVN